MERTNIKYDLANLMLNNGVKMKISFSDPAEMGLTFYGRDV